MFLLDTEPNRTDILLIHRNQNMNLNSMFYMDTDTHTHRVVNTQRHTRAAAFVWQIEHLACAPLIRRQDH